MINNKILGLMGLAAKARKIAYGADSVEEQAKNKKLGLIIIADDASERTKDKFKKLANLNKIPIITFGNIETISKSIGKRNKAVIGINDMNLSKEIQKIFNGGDIIG